MIIGPVRFYAYHSDPDTGQVVPGDPNMWRIQQVHPSPPRIQLFYCLVPIPYYQDDRSNRQLIKYDFENAFQTLQWMVDHGELP